MAWSIYVRTRAFHVYYWIDEGLSVGIAQHGLFDIPNVLRQDGSPPLYYVLLHFWIDVFGSDEVETHAMSLVFSTLAIPVGLWAGWTLYGRFAGIVTGILCAGSPYLTAYAQETRMYSLVGLLSLLCTAFFLLVFVQRRRRFLPWFAVTLIALLYTHLWSAFFIIGVGASILWLMWIRREQRRELLRDALLGFAGAAVLYLPWLPIVVSQVRHTAAPWAAGPTYRAYSQLPHTLAGGNHEIWLTVVVVLVGLFVASRVRRRGEPAAHWVRGDTSALRVVGDHTGWIAFGLLATMVGLAWIISHLSEVWVPRYFAIFLGPFLLWLGWAFARAGVIGIVGLAILGAGFQLYPHTPEKLHLKSNVKLVAADGAPLLRPGDIVMVTHPEQVPLVYHYMTELGEHDLRYATQMGWFPDPQVMDWRDVTEKLEATRVSYNLTPIIDQMEVGQRMYMIRPITTRRSEWRAPWTYMVARRAAQWVHGIERDPRMELGKVSNPFLSVGHRNGAVQGRLYTKTHD